MSKSYQSNPKASRRFILLKIAEGLANWIIDFVSMPLRMISIAILRAGGVLIEATGGKVSQNEGLDAVVLRGILIALFIYSSIQYSQQAGAVAASITWIPAWASVWAGLVVGAILNLATQILQARALRRDTLKGKKSSFISVNERRISEDEMEDLVDIAKAKAKQFNRSEMIKFRVMGVFAAGAWLAELWVMALNPVIPWTTPWLHPGNLVCLAVSIILTFAFEVFAQMDTES